MPQILPVLTCTEPFRLQMNLEANSQYDFNYQLAINKDESSAAFCSVQLAVSHSNKI